MLEEAVDVYKRQELCHADMVLPSLDAYNQEISKKIDRPYGTIKFEEEFEGLKKFTQDVYKRQFRR